MLKIPAYIIVSSVFFILIGMGFAYSYFFYPDAHPIHCLVKSYTGKDCPACGFSRSFSYYSHLQFAAGKLFNPLSWPVFLFFAFQALARFGIVAWYYKRHVTFKQEFIVWDVSISISLFLLAFLPVILKN